MNAVAFRSWLVSHSVQLGPMKMDQADFNAKSVSFLSQSLFRDWAGTGNVALCHSWVSSLSVQQPEEENGSPNQTAQDHTDQRKQLEGQTPLSFLPTPAPPRSGHFLVFVHGASDEKIQTIKCAWEPLSHFSCFTIMFTYLINRDAIFNLLSFFYPSAKAASLFIPKGVKPNCQQL